MMQLFYFFIFLLGFWINIEIALIAGIRETLYSHYLAHNAGTIYGADDIGAGIGEESWLLFMLGIEIS